MSASSAQRVAFSVRLADGLSRVEVWNNGQPVKQKKYDGDKAVVDVVSVTLDEGTNRIEIRAQGTKSPMVVKKLTVGCVPQPLRVEVEQVTDASGRKLRFKI